MMMMMMMMMMIMMMRHLFPGKDVSFAARRVVYVERDARVGREKDDDDECLQTYRDVVRNDRPNAFATTIIIIHRKVSRIRLENASQKRALLISRALFFFFFFFFFHRLFRGGLKEDTTTNVAS